MNSSLVESEGAELGSQRRWSRWENGAGAAASGRGGEGAELHHLVILDPKANRSAIECKIFEDAWTTRVNQRIRAIFTGYKEQAPKSRKDPVHNLIDIIAKGRP